MAYLKDIVKQAGGTLHLKIESIGAAQTKQGSNGSYDVKPVTFTIPATGKQIIENIFATTFEFDLNGVTAGMHVEAYSKTTKTGKEVVGYKILKADSENSYTAPSQTPQKQVAAERAATEHIDAQAEKSIAICLQGFMQAYVAGGDPFHREDFGAVIENAMEFATKSREALLKKAKDIYMQETFAQDA